MPTPVNAYPRISRPIRVYLGLSRTIEAYPLLSGPIQSFSGLYRSFHAYPGLCRPIQPNSRLPRPIQAYTCTRIRAYQGLSWLIQAYPVLSKPTHAHPGLSNPSILRQTHAYPRTSGYVHTNPVCLRLSRPTPSNPRLPTLIRANRGLTKHTQANLSLFGPIQAYPWLSTQNRLSKLISAYPSQYRLAHAFPRLFGPIQACFDLFWHMPAYPAWPILTKLG